MSRSASVVEARADGGAYAVGDRRHLTFHRLELAPEHDDDAHRRRGDDVRRPPFRLEQADLPEEVAGPELRERLTLVRHLGRAFLDHEELVREFALGREPLTLTDRDLVRPLRQLLQILLRQAREEADAFKSLGIHGAIMSADGGLGKEAL